MVEYEIISTGRGSLIVSCSWKEINVIISVDVGKVWFDFFGKLLKGMNFFRKKFEFLLKMLRISRRKHLSLQNG